MIVSSEVTIINESFGCADETEKDAGTENLGSGTGDGKAEKAAARRP
jgi:hypothetical protein